MSYIFLKTVVSTNIDWVKFIFLNTLDLKEMEKTFQIVQSRCQFTLSKAGDIRAFFLSLEGEESAAHNLVHKIISLLHKTALNKYI